MNPFGRSWNARMLPYLGLLPGLCLFILFGVGPSLATAVYSFTDATGSPGIPIHFIGWHNYALLWATATNPYDQQGLFVVIRHTVEFSVVVTLVQNAIALGIALVLNAKIRGRVFVRSIVFLPTILGVTVVGLIWSLILSPIGGPAASVWHWFGAQSSFLGSNSLALPLVIMIQIWMAMGWSVLIFLAGLQTIPTDLYEASTLDGASKWQNFRHVTFPLLASSVTVNVLLAIIGSLQTYDTIYVLTQGNANTMTLGMMVYNNAFTSGQQGYGASIAMVMFVLVLIAATGSQLYLRRREERLI